MSSGATHWDDLDEQEAAAIFERVVAEHPERVRAALDRLERLGVSPAALDFSPASLEVIWPVVLRSAPPLPVEPEVEIVREDLPPWAAFRLSCARQIGMARVELAALVAAYFAECALRTDRGAGWVIGDVPNQNGFRKPLLAFSRGARVSVEDLVAKTLVRALDGDDLYAEQDAAPNGLRRHLDIRMPDDDVTSAEPVEFDVRHEGGGSFHVSVGPEIDDALSDQLDELVARLRQEPAIVTAVREDRDVILVSAPALDADNVHALFGSAWSPVRGRPGAD